MRLFFALWPPAAAATQLATIAASCAAKFGGRPMRQETLHLTLAFLGELPQQRLPALLAAADKLKALGPSPFTVAVDRLGLWQEQRLLWAGCSSPAPALGELASSLRGALETSGFAVVGQPGAFAPHITLLRKTPMPNAALATLAMPAIAWHCDGFSLIRSQPASDGPRYASVGEFHCRR